MSQDNLRVIKVNPLAGVRQRGRGLTNRQSFVYAAMMFIMFNAVLLAAMFGVLDIPGPWLFFGILGLGLLAIILALDLKADR